MSQTAVARPGRTQQRMDALSKGNAVRTWRAEVKRDWHENPASFEEAIEILFDPPPEVASWKALGFVLSLPGLGRVRAMKLISGVHIAPTRTLGRLTQRERLLLAVAIRRAIPPRFR